MGLTGFEPVTSCLSSKRSPPELEARNVQCWDRTSDFCLVKAALSLTELTGRAPLTPSPGSLRSNGRPCTSSSFVSGVTHLLGTGNRRIELRVVGLEPTVLPLHQSPIKPSFGIEPKLPPYEGGILPARSRGRVPSMIRTITVTIRTDQFTFLYFSEDPTTSL